MGTFLISLASTMRNVPISLLLLALPFGANAQAYFHHVHLNATDPASAIEFYTSRFKARKESFAKGTRFATPITDISDMVGGNRPFFYAYPVEYRGGGFVSTRGRALVEGPDQVAIELIQDATPRPAAVSD